MHDDVKNELLMEHADYPDKMKFIDTISLPVYDQLKEIPAKRFLKTHFPFSLMPPSVMKNKAKVNWFFIYNLI